jgi:hypothetical protein
MGGFIFLVFLIVGFIIVMSTVQSRKGREAWLAAAQQLGFQCEPGGAFSRPTIRGTFRRYQVTVSAITRGSGKSSATYTQFRVAYPRPLDTEVRISQEGFSSKLAKFFGSQDIQTGDAAFDASVIVQGPSAEEVVRFLTPPRRAEIVNLLETHRGAVIDETQITWELRGFLRDPERITGTVRSLVDFAQNLLEPSEQDVEPAPDYRVQWTSEAASAALAAAAAAVGAVADAGAVEPVTSNEPKTTKPPPTAHAERQHPPRREIPKPPERHAETPAAEQPAALTPDVESMCKALFNPKMTSFDAQRLFEQRYRGASIGWHGVLRSTEAYSLDLVFGSKPGLRATFEICALPASGYGESTVTAVVQLPPEAAAALEGRTGETFSLTGTLLKIDGFLRTFFVAAGSVHDGGK